MLQGVQTAISSAYGQLQRQQAQNYADQAERRAVSLRDQADSARAMADQAERLAVSLDVDADKARSRADLAGNAVTSMQAWDRMGDQQSAQRVQMARSVQPAEPVIASSSPASPAASYVQEPRVGTLLDLSA